MKNITFNILVYVTLTALVFIEKVQATKAHSRIFPNKGLFVSEKTSLAQFACLRHQGFRDYIVISAFENNAPNPNFFENYYNAVQSGFQVIDLQFSICPVTTNTTAYLNNIMKNFFYNIPIYNQNRSNSNSSQDNHKFNMYLRKNIIVKFELPLEKCMQWRFQSYEQNCRFFNDTVNMLQLTYLQDFGVQTNFEEWVHLFGHPQACNSQEEQYPINFYPLIWTGDKSGNPNFDANYYQEFAAQLMPQLKYYKHDHDCGGNIGFISF